MRIPSLTKKKFKKWNRKHSKLYKEKYLSKKRRKKR
jgi:hypothetical protein